MAGITEILRVARNWRLNEPESHQTGVVLIWDGKVYGWKNELRDASHEQPGAIAVDDAGRVFQAEGGDSYNGASAWVVVVCRASG